MSQYPKLTVKPEASSEPEEVVVHIQGILTEIDLPLVSLMDFE